MMPKANAGQIHITPFQTADASSVRRILERIGWNERYILAFEQAALRFARDEDAAVFMARRREAAVGFIFVEYHAWNRLAQIQGLAVDPDFHRQGVASALAAQAETFARGRRARGVYVDTPAANERGRRFYEAMGYQTGYIMPRYYDDALDGVTYQKFFNAPGNSETPETPPEAAG
jgi:ribosomal protein S18 acetylase RimI-like enzyme